MINRPKYTPVQQWRELKAERDELLAAAKRARAYLWGADSGEGLDEQLGRAIRKAEGVEA